MTGVQEICDRTALASGKTLGALIAVRFNRVWQLAIGALIACARRRERAEHRR